MARENRNRKYDREWPHVAAVLVILAIVVIFCCGFARALEMAAW